MTPDPFPKTGEVGAQALQARGRMALRVLKLRQKAATYQVIAAELEAALVLSEQGDTAGLEKWMRRYSELSHSSEQPTTNDSDHQRYDGAHLSSQWHRMGDDGAGNGSVRIDGARSSVSERRISDSSPWEGMLSGAESRLQARVSKVPSERIESTPTTSLQEGVTAHIDCGLAPFPLGMNEGMIPSTTHVEQPIHDVVKSIDDQLSQSGPDRQDLIVEQSRHSKPTKGHHVAPSEFFNAAGRATHDESDVANRRVAIPSWLISLGLHIGLVGSLLFTTFEVVQPEPVSITAAAWEGDVALFETPVDVQPLLSQDELSNEPMSGILDGQLPQLGELSTTGSQLNPSFIDSTGSSISESLGISKALGSGSGLSSRMNGIQFFGVQAVGNSFVYLVDSSGSMRRDGAFDAAKAELLRSLSSLKPTQRFFVIFFSDVLEVMTLNGRDPEDYPVYATPENLRSVFDWVSRIQIRGGRSPNDAFDLAIKMSPDAIYLLFDGETRTDVAGHLRKVNRVTDIISGTVPRVSIHTIGFYSQEHEAALRTIAAENTGTYRFVPKPLSPISRK